MKILLIPFILISITFADNFKLRKYNNVKSFYESIAKDVVQLSIEYKTPPATILAIAGLESGYGSGYVAQITGNILSLGAGKAEKELPALKLPYCKDDKRRVTLFDPKDQQNCKSLIWKERPKSLKKDYRPKNIAGTKQNLAFFKNSPELYRQAQLNNIKDFLTKWISKNNRYQPFKQSRVWLNNKVNTNGIGCLFDLQTNIEFINHIGGKQNSFNYRKSWPKKVEYIMKNTGLIELCKDIYYKNYAFKKAWNKKI